MNEVESRWSVPPDWAGEPCFVIGGGESVNAAICARLKGHIIAIKHAALLRPDAEVLFMAGKGWERDFAWIVERHTGRLKVRRGFDSECPATIKQVRRMKVDQFTGLPALSDMPSHVAGLDAGGSAINLAYLFGADPIGLLGFDMKGGHHFKDHPTRVIPRSHFERHALNHGEIAKALKACGRRVVNLSPITALDCYERGRLDDFV